MLDTLRYIKSHPTNWRELLQAPPFSITIREAEDLALLKYNQVSSDFSQSICRECRGLVIDTKTLKPVALSFVKFFNYSEQYADNLDWKSAIVREKIDGSKILVFYHGGWHVSTSGVLDAYKAPVQGCDLTFGDLWEQALDNNGLAPRCLYNSLDPNYCYTFELVSPETRVVINYPKADVYLIGIRRVDTFEELDVEDLDLGVKIPKRFHLSDLKSCLKAARELGSSKEGFVAQDRDFKRVTIKSPAYVALHHVGLNGPVTESRILEIMEAGECSEFFGYFPEYLPIKESVENKKRLFFTLVAPVCASVKCTYVQTSRKEVAQLIMRKFAGLSSLLFASLDSDLPVGEFLQDYWTRLTIQKKCELLGLADQQRSLT